MCLFLSSLLFALSDVCRIITHVFQSCLEEMHTILCRVIDVKSCNVQFANNELEFIYISIDINNHMVDRRKTWNLKNHDISLRKPWYSLSWGNPTIHSVMWMSQVLVTGAHKENHHLLHTLGWKSKGIFTKKKQCKYSWIAHKCPIGRQAITLSTLIHFYVDIYETSMENYIAWMDWI